MTEEFKNEQIKSAMKLNDINFKEYWREDEEYIDFQSFLRPKTAAIYEHELKARKEQLEEDLNGYIGRFSSANCQSFDCEGEHVCLAYSGMFIGMIINGLYLDALNRFPECFETGNAVDVVIALYKNGYENSGWDYQRFIDIVLTHDVCCYVALLKDGKFDDEILRIDLFRQIKPNKKDWHKMDFIGGLFHVFKHFSYKGKNLSTGKEVKHNSVDSLMSIVVMCINAFILKQKEENGNDYVFDQKLDEGKILRYVFYKEEETKTFYIKSVHIE